MKNTYIIAVSVFVLLSIGIGGYYVSKSKPAVAPTEQNRQNMSAATTPKTETSIKKELSKEYEIKPNGVYYEGRLIDIADPQTFEVLNRFISKDKEQVYYQYLNEASNVIFLPLKNADPQTFEILSDWYAKDKFKVYASLDYSTSILRDADPLTFVAVDGYYGKDKNNVYFYGIKIKEADPATFVGYGVKNAQYAKDIKNAYYRNEIIQGVDLKTFKVIDGKFSKDIKHVYVWGEITGGADPSKCTMDNLMGCEGQ
ncbi:MAG: DKNYY domain-containing protein [Candidatus Paceibacterota bacterium]|jgi:hypothetical protein